MTLHLRSRHPARWEDWASSVPARGRSWERSHCSLRYDEARIDNFYKPWRRQGERLLSENVKFVVCYASDMDEWAMNAVHPSCSATCFARMRDASPSDYLIDIDDHLLTRPVDARKD